MSADNILVLQDGRVVEEGAHDHLLLLNGVYAKMWQVQLREPLPPDDTYSSSY